jgi:hypothetical protein
MLQELETTLNAIKDAQHMLLGVEQAGNVSTSETQLIDLVKKSFKVNNSKVISAADIQVMLVILDKIIRYFVEHFVDDTGKVIKFSFIKLIFDGAYRQKFFDAIMFLKETVEEIINLFKK